MERLIPMEDVSLRPLTAANWQACIDLRVREDQKNFVAPNVYSLAEARIYPECVPQAIYAGETMVGFVMYALSKEDQRHWIIRLMVDQRFQGLGYGRAALRLVIEEMRQMPGCERIYLSYEPENEHAEQLYARFGFLPTGEILEGEKVVCLELSKVDGFF
jgi:diamine N-acetyltransferase